MRVTGAASRAVLLAGAVAAGLILLLFVRQIQQGQQLQQELLLTRQHVAELEAQNQTLTQQLDGLQGERSNLEERVTSLRTQLATVSSDLEQARKSLEEFQERYDRLTEERAKLQTDLTTVSGERDEARSQWRRLEQENAELKRSVVRLRERLTLLDRDYQQMADKLAQVEAMHDPALNPAPPVIPVVSVPAPVPGSSTSSSIPGTVELPPIIVHKESAARAAAVRGRLVQVNAPHNFIIVDKGSLDGVQVGMVFDILRGATTVGRATVVRVRPQLSACDIIRAQTPSSLQVGDLAVQSGS